MMIGNAKVGNRFRRQVQQMDHAGQIILRAAHVQMVGNIAGRANVHGNPKKITRRPRPATPITPARTRCDGLQPRLIGFFGVGDAKPQQQAHRRPGAEAVIFQPRAALNRKEKQDHARPGKQQQSRLRAETRCPCPSGLGKAEIPAARAEERNSRGTATPGGRSTTPRAARRRSHAGRRVPSARLMCSLMK